MAFGHLPSGRAAKLAALALSILTIVFIYSLAPADSAFAAQATVAWDPDASPGLAGYKIYWGTVSRNYSWSADAGTQTTYTVPSLSEGATYYFAATAYNATRNESDFSNEATHTVPTTCTYAISPAGQSMGAGGGTASTTVSTGTACNWTTSNTSPWVSITSGASGTGGGTVTYTAAANTGTASRTAGLTIAGQILTITQAGTSTYTLSVSNSGTGSGTVTGSPTGTTFGAGTSVTLTAKPGANSTFAGWSGACSGTATTCTVVMNSNLSVTAAFNAQNYTITASAAPNGSITPSGNVAVNGGSSQTFTLTPATGYTVADVKVDGSSVGAVSSYTFTGVAANHTIQASFAQSQVNYTLTTTTSGTGSGTVTGSPTGTTFGAGTSVSLTAKPGANSTFAGWSGACSGTATTCTVIMNSNLSVTAAFNAPTYTISASAYSGGSISPSGNVTVNGGSSQMFTLTPATGYTVADVKVDGTWLGPVGSYTFTNVAANHTILASFAQSQVNYTLTTTPSGTGSGTVTSSPSGTTFSASASVTLTAKPGANSTFAGWSGACSGTATTCTVIMNSNLSVTAAFNAPTYTLTASAGANGTISPSGSVSVNAGASQSLTISPVSGYQVAAVTVDGSSVGAVTSYAFSNVSANHTIAASFVATPSPASPPPSPTCTAAPSAATTVFPSGTTTATPTYTWNAVPCSSWYYLWVNDSTGTRFKQWYTAAQAGCASGKGTCSVTPATALANGSGTWWIQAWDDAGYGPWSGGMNFTVSGGDCTTPPGAATLISPSGTTTATPTYTWDAVPCSSRYYLWVSDITGNRIQQWYTAEQAGCASGTGTCSVTPSTTLYAGSAMWWIQTRDDAGYGPRSPGMVFKVRR